VQYLYDYDAVSQEPHVKAAVLALSLVAAAVTHSSPVALAKGEDVTLRYKWTQGDVLNYRSTLRTASAMSGVPNIGDVSLNQTMTQNIKLFVASVAADGTAVVQQTIESVKIEMTTPMGTTSYDSAAPAPPANPAAEALATVFGGMVGGSISITFAANGSVQRIDGAARLLDKLVQGLPQEPRAQQMAQSLRSMLSDDAIRASLEQSFSKLPPQPVKAGDTWNGTVSLGNDMIGKIVGTQTFTLKAMEGDLAVVPVALTLKQETVSPVGPAGMTIKLGDSKGEGEIRFDVAKGRIQRATMKTEMPSTMTTTGPDGRPVTMKNTTTTSMTMELVQKQEVR
jgi:hypothetical protein